MRAKMHPVAFHLLNFFFVAYAQVLWGGAEVGGGGGRSCLACRPLARALRPTPPAAILTRRGRCRQALRPLLRTTPLHFRCMSGTWCPAGSRCHGNQHPACMRTYTPGTHAAMLIFSLSVSCARCDVHAARAVPGYHTPGLRGLPGAREGDEPCAHSRCRRWHGCFCGVPGRCAQACWHPFRGGGSIWHGCMHGDSLGTQCWW